jgi:hypothetical protein
MIEGIVLIEFEYRALLSELVKKLRTSYNLFYHLSAQRFLYCFRVKMNRLTHAELPDLYEWDGVQ